MTTETLQYQTGTPSQTGVYACRIPIPHTRFWDDRFMLWYNDEWSYYGSDQHYRHIPGTPEIRWIGPLQRKLELTPEEQNNE